MRRSLVVAALLVACTTSAPVAPPVPSPSTLAARSAPCQMDAVPGGPSVARRWDEALLDAIRRAVPNPPVHARNLFHLSVAMWDAWAVYDPEASGYLFKEKYVACDRVAARNEAISFAAYRVLTARFANAIGHAASQREFDGLMSQLGYPLSVMGAPRGSAPDVGDRVAATVLAYGQSDGANEAGGYAPSGYRPVNAPLNIALTDIQLRDPDRWQPLEIGYQVTQNGVPIAGSVQQALGVHWGHVKPFAIASGGISGVPIDPGSQPRSGGAAFKQQVVEVIRDSALLDPVTSGEIDISPRSRGANVLGTNDGIGYATNPVTGRPYRPNAAPAGDFYRAIAEFWADGPNSETPPGHWNVIANAVSDRLAGDLRVGGEGPIVSRLEWDVKLYLALNGAVHDAAIAAWGVKGRYDGARPISMIRYMASRGQSSDPALGSFDPDGLPLVPGLVELVTRAKTAANGSMVSLRGHEGEIAVRSWMRRESVDPNPHLAWILGSSWMPFQLPTFVTPSFPGYISGHSTFSRAAAEVLASFTDSPFFPGGLSTWTVRAGSFRIDAGPSRDVALQWATYYDAADQAGQSRLFGGIHVVADDFAGRVVGSQCGKDAWKLAQRYYAGKP